LGEKGRWRKQTLWRESTRVPFIVVAPGVTKAGSKIAATVSLLDLYPTLVELAGLDIPTHPEGISLLPLIEDPDIEWDHAAISTNDFGNHAVSTDQYRYIQYVDDTEELYDIKSDPNEWHNLAGDPELGPVKERLIALLPKHDESADRAASRNAD